MKEWAIIWSSMALLALAGMCMGARWMWGLAFIAGIMLCGALAEIEENKQKDEDHGNS